MKSNMARRALTVAAALALAATAAAAANAIAVDPGEQRQGSLASFGPLMDNGFPTSYKDSHALRLEACITAADPLCASAAGDTYDPDQPLSFPNNFPDEFFYQLASAKVPVPGNGELLVENNLEGAFLGNGSPAKDQQVVFGRVRIRAKDVPAGTTWRITHPYGVDVLTAADKGMNETEDIGVAAGNFSGALSSRIGPFLKWDPSVAPAAPAGYTGDPGVLHKVVGSPYDTNYIKVEQKNDDGSWSQVGQWDDQFSVQGRLAVNSGVEVDAATFTGDDNGGFLDVYASSDAAQSIAVSANATLGTPAIPMREVDGRYYARIAVDTKIPAGTKIEVVNTADTPVAKKTVAITDQVTVTSATYDADSEELTIQAKSSDMESGGDAPALSLAGYGALGSNGQATFETAAPPAVLKVTSSAGGSDSETPVASGDGFAALAPVAQFFVPASVQAGDPVPLDGRASVGSIQSYDWTTDDGTVTPDPNNPGLATWTPDTVNAAATVTLKVTGPAGESTASNTVEVTPPLGVLADAGPDQVKTRGQVVTLAGKARGQQSVLWTQVSGPQVKLSSTTTLNPTFTYPKMALPFGPAGQATAGYVLNNEPIVLQLTATPASGSVATDTVRISPTPETITPGTARYRTRGEWRVTGTTDLKAGQTVAMVLGSDPETGQFIGQATIDAAGAFSFKGGGQPVATGTTVTYISSTGGTATGPLLITP